jgi:hypothetical protein
MNKRRLALVTYRDHPELTDSDRLLVEPLHRNDVRTFAVPWDDPAIDWASFDLLVLRSCWDYHLRSGEFRDWIERMAAMRVSLWNLPRAVLWNMDKIYLRDLEQAGVPIVPTAWLEPGAQSSLEEILERRGWAEAVVKPRIGASAFGAWQTRSEAARDHEVQFRAQQMQAGLMVQKLVREIAGGEWSIVFFRGEYSHAVLKKPGAGHIFSQEETGGSVNAAPIPARLVEQAAYVLRSAAAHTLPPGDMFLYARVDGIDVEGQLVLMELEIIEPDLYLDRVPQSAERFAQAIIELSTGQKHR